MTSEQIDLIVKSMIGKAAEAMSKIEMTDEQVEKAKQDALELVEIMGKEDVDKILTGVLTVHENMLRRAQKALDRIREVRDVVRALPSSQTGQEQSDRVTVVDFKLKNTTVH